MNITIRAETAADISAIKSVTRRAFEFHPFSHQTEHFIVKALRESGALSVSLVAEADGIVVGHIAFSPVGIADGSPDWYALGPISVIPEFQRQGIGAELVGHGIKALTELSARGCVVLGEPGFYGKFGFKPNPDIMLDGVPEEYFLSLVLTEGKIAGRVTYHTSFSSHG